MSLSQASPKELRAAGALEVLEETCSSRTAVSCCLSALKDNTGGATLRRERGRHPERDAVGSVLTPLRWPGSTSPSLELGTSQALLQGVELSQESSFGALAMGH